METLCEEEQWVRDVRVAGDKASFRKIFQKYYKPLYFFAQGYVGPDLASDVVQSTFLNIWDRKQYWEPNCTLKQYLFTAVRNESLNVLKRQRLEKDYEEAVANLFKEFKKSSDINSGSDIETLRYKIQEGIEQLPKRCRQIFLLSRKSGLTYSEIATVLNISEATVGTQIGRALRSLEKHLAEYL